MKVINIYSKSDVYPEAELSNFCRYPFVFDGVRCESMEGFLQSLKYMSVKRQEKVCLCFGKAAKQKGKRKLLWKLLGKVWWRGRAYKRRSKDFDDLVGRAYFALYNANAEFRAALDSTVGCRLTHDLGSHDPRKTILTEEEFINHLISIRDKETHYEA